MKHYLRRYHVAQALLLALAAASLAMIASPAHSVDLPPRPKPAPEIVGAFIELTVDDAPAGVWTMVQWQDGLGGWHDVGGWQGTLDNGIIKLWWVAPKDFDTGPFRWLVFAGSEMQLQLGSSESFNLPDKDGEVVRVEVELG